MRRDTLGIIRFRYVRESEFDAMPEETRDLYTRYIVFKDDSDEILYEYLYGQRIEPGANEEDILNILNQFTYNQQTIESRDLDILDAAKQYTDDQFIEGVDFLNIINLDTESKDKLTLFVIDGQLGYEIEEEE